MASEREIQTMRLAIALSAHGLGTTSPNPPVGCVILDQDGEIVGTGHHQRKGESHAEVYALAAAGARAAGGTAVVTLEPCNHIGRTPACRQALIDARVARVVIALVDPTSRGEGGAAMLRVAGIDVEVGALDDEARLVLGPWLIAQGRGWPFVVTGYAVGKDGLQPLEPHAMAELRPDVDAVLHDDSRVEEAIAGVHGRNILRLPPTVPMDEPVKALRQLYTNGIRLLLLDGSAEFVAQYVSAGLVDRLLVNWLVRPEASDRTSAYTPPRGYRTDTVGRYGEVLRMECAL